MTNIRCSNCGFLNFAEAAFCKRCKAIFEEPPAADMSQQFTQFPPALQGGYQAVAQWPQQAFQPSYFPTPIAPLPRASKNGATNAVLWTLLSLTITIALGIGFIWRFAKPSPTITGWQEYTSQDGSFTVQNAYEALRIRRERGNSRRTTSNSRDDGKYAGEGNIHRRIHRLSQHFKQHFH